MPADLVGRESERAALRTLDCAGALLLLGDAGIGKTAVWEWAVGHARAAGDSVLVTRASAAEARLPWVGLSDLLREIPATTYDELPVLQQRALRTVVLEADPSEGLDDERVVATAFLGVLVGLARSAPVLVAIDDLPYLDAATARALLFAFRRLPDTAPIRLIATARGDTAPALISDVPRDRLVVHTVGALSVGGLFELLDERLDLRLPRPVLSRVHDTSRGNPLYALELARELTRLGGAPQPGVPLAVPSTLDALVHARVRDLPTAVRAVAAGPAATWRFTTSGLDDAALAQAVDAQLVRVDGTMVRSAHPILSAAAYSALDDGERSALHLRLAACAEVPAERARHLALGAHGPDEEIADALDAGADSALLAGVPDLAIELAELALWHTVEPTQRPARLDRLADAKMRAGDSAGAFSAQQEAVDLTIAGPARARRRIRLAEIDVEVHGWASAETELDAAVAESEADPAVAAEVLLSIAAVTDDIAKADAAASRAVALLDALVAPDPVILSGALCQAAGAKLRSGRGLDHELFARAIALERAFPARRLSDRADASYAALLKYADDLDGARARLTDLLQEARNIGDLTSIAYVLAHLVHVEAWAGNLDAAERTAAEHLAVAEQGSLRGQGAQARYNLASVFAYRGRLDEARSMLVELRDDQATDTWDRHRSHGALGFVALSAGDPATAIEHLDAWDAMLRAMHFREPGYSRSHLDRLCALVGVGRIDDASTFAAELRAQAEATGRASASAVALTGEALVAAHSDRVDDAQRMFDDVIRWYDASPLRFDRARTLLLAGQVHRRAKSKARARDVMLEAHREFTTFGAQAWAAITADELARVNVRPRASNELTETERQVAMLAGAGLTNREVAARSFLAVKTVEANLARVYRKLGIASRAELGARMASE
ncbi:MAG TPA: AAA family ATPase [Acidimicrobiia bacterium]